MTDKDWIDFQKKLLVRLPAWRELLEPQFAENYFRQLIEFVDADRKTEQVFPPEEDVFQALECTNPTDIKVVVLGQDPYHDDNQAHGLSFSVQKGVKVPPSLRNIYKELNADLGIEIPNHGYLKSWADQGVLLLNTVLTVRAHQANSHRKKGWETFTDQVLKFVNQQSNIVFVLWGKPAQTKKPLISEGHLVLESAHPSPLSARRGFIGSRPFSKINQYLAEHGKSEIDWQIESE